MTDNIRNFLKEQSVASTEQLEAEPNELKVTGAYPCIFKIGNNFYDYTLFKLAS